MPPDSGRGRREKQPSALDRSPLRIRPRPLPRPPAAIPGSSPAPSAPGSSVPRSRRAEAWTAATQRFAQLLAIGTARRRAGRGRRRSGSPAGRAARRGRRSSRSATRPRPTPDAGSGSPRRARRPGRADARRAAGRPGRRGRSSRRARVRLELHVVGQRHPLTHHRHPQLSVGAKSQNALAAGGELADRSRGRVAAAQHPSLTAGELAAAPAASLAGRGQAPPRSAATRARPRPNPRWRRADRARAAPPAARPLRSSG